MATGKKSNKDSAEKVKVSENAGESPESVKSSEKRPPGRPSGYTQEIADLICEALAEGHSLREICKSDNMPNKGTVFRWLAQNKLFSDQYARAREEQADCLFDDILSIADDGRNDTYEDDEGRIRTDHDVIARSRLRVDARKWMAGKLRPKVYGEKVALVGDPSQPIHTETTLNVAGLSTETLAEIMALRDASNAK